MLETRKNYPESDPESLIKLLRALKCPDCLGMKAACLDGQEQETECLKYILLKTWARFGLTELITNPQGHTFW